MYFRFAQEGVPFSSLQATFAYDVDDGLGNLLSIYLRDVWAEPYTLTLTLFLPFFRHLYCGDSSAGPPGPGHHSAGGTPFSLENAAALHRAAVASFIIAVAALVRVIFSVCFFHSPLPILTYNALFVPIFSMFGLLCLVMSALFRQAAEMKAEQDLTI